MLNKYQEDVVYCENVKPLLVEAGPGSGKTFVIVERIKFLLENGAEPETFLAITFSRKAAKQLKDKLYEELPRETVDKMQISTIHSFCLDFLNENGENVAFIDDDNSERKELFLKRFRKKLGFVDEFTLRNFKPVISKFKEYTNFNVDTPELIKYLSENKPFSEEYVEFVHNLDWFKKEVVKKKYKDDWYNAKFLQVARAYPIYLDLLERYGYVDYDTVQKDTLNLLENGHRNEYRHVLIDEFQDTDPIQARIFKKLIDESDSFMAVGDMDQRIYFFRGAYGDYFDVFSKDYDVEVYPLNVNHRSSNEIIAVSEEFIKDKRAGYSDKKLEPYRNVSNDSYILNNESPEEEAFNIFNFIKYLKDNEIVEDYGDIAVLTYSVLNSKTIPILIEHLLNNQIPVNVSDFNDLGDKDEIKSMITLLYYITRKNDSIYFHKVEEEWGGLKAFNGEAFTPTFWSLADSTKQYLADLEDEFRELARNTEEEIINDLGMRGSKSSRYDRIFANRDEDFLEILFQRIQRPTIDLNEITDETDREFFIRLNEISSSIKDKENRPTILEIYYQLLELGGYFSEDVLNSDDYSQALQNLAAITKTIENYENYFSKYYVQGLLSFLIRMIENYSSSEISDDGVQIMTVHKAKGLEFPVTILASLQKDKFPPIPKDPERKNKFAFRNETFYTPNYCLNYKTTTEDEDNELEILEGIRLVYVGMTRARDILLLSTLEEVPEEIEKISHLLKEFDLNDLTEKKVIKDDKELPEEKLNISYSSFNTYSNCPLKYKLTYDFEFKTSSSDEADMGSLTHRVLDAVNHSLKLNKDISENEVEEISRKIYSSRYEILDDDEDFDEFYDNIQDYVDEFLDHDLEVIDSEVPFSIEFDDYIINGAIDLIYKDGDSIKVLDYKNSEYNQSNMEKYKTQLLIYILALMKDPYYKQFNLDRKQASIYLLQSNKLLKLSFDDESELNDLLFEIEKVTSNINDNHFESNKSDYCNICEFKPYCERGKNG